MASWIMGSLQVRCRSCTRMKSKDSASVPPDPLQLRDRVAVPLAPRWHTTALIALILAVALTGTVLGANSVAAGAALARERILGAYVPLLVVSWGLTMYVARLGRPRSALGALVGRGWDGFGRASADLFLASVAWLAIETVEAVAGKWRNAAAVALLPHSSFERVAWVLVAMTAGFC